MKDKKSRFFSFMMIASSIAILLVTPILLLTFLGLLVDKMFHTSPMFVIFGGLGGLIGGLHNVYKLIKRLL